MIDSKMKVAELRKLAEEKAIEGWQDMDKKELVVALQEAPKEPESTPEPEGKVPGELAEPAKEKPKPTPLPVGISEGQAVYDGKAAKMKEHLAAQPKVRILIPLETGEKKGATVSVILNGYRQNIMKGVYVEVPEQIADVIMDSQKQSNILVEHPLRVDESNSALNK